LWQAPLLAVAVFLLAGGIITALVSRPKPDVSRLLDQAQHLIESRHYDEALDSLDKRVWPLLDGPDAPDQALRRFHVLAARGLHLAQADRGISVEENNQRIVRHYLDAESRGASLGPVDLSNLAEAYLALGQSEAALTRARAIPDQQADRRISLLKRIVRERLDQPSPDYPQIGQILDQMLDDASLDRQSRLWVRARQSEIRLARGLYDEAITKLLHLIARESDGPPESLGELHLLLGRAYFQTDAFEQAGTHLREALRLIPSLDSRQARALTLLAEVAVRGGELNEALDLYQRVEREFSDTPMYAEALLGTARVRASLGDIDSSMASYRSLVDLIDANRESPMIAPERVAESLLDRYDEAIAGGNIGRARDEAELALAATTLDHALPAVIEALARVYRSLADEALEVDTPARNQRVRLAGLEPAVRERAREWLVRAGRFFHLHAERMVLSDDSAYADSLWRAADTFDMAGVGSEDDAIGAFLEFIDGLPRDPRRFEARFRLAQIYEARGDFDLAERLYKELVSAGSEAGPLADRSFVPLARSYLLDSDKANDAQAERLLLGAVGGTVQGLSDPEASEFPSALLELGEYYYREGRYPEAIERLAEAIRRGVDPDREGMVRFRLADAQRLEAQAIETTLREAMPESRRRELEQVRTERLQSAIDDYERARAILEAQAPGDRSRLESMSLRNAYYFVGGCAFDLADYDRAIRLYDRARERYPRDPATLTALAQIVSAYIAKGDYARAEAANERARRFHKSLPAEVWSDPDLPMSRQDWERWIQSMSTLSQVGSSSTASAGG